VCCVENGYDWVDLCRLCNESQWSVLPQCLILSADAANDQACCRRYVCLSSRQRSISSCKDTIKQLQQEPLDFTGPDLWPTNSPNQNLVDYKVWGVMQQRVYECHEQCWWAQAAPRWSLEQSAAERYWRGHKHVEKATESMRAWRWTTFWKFVASACD